MGHLTELVARSPGHLLKTLGITKPEAYQEEFKELLEDNPDLALEDWSTEPEVLEVFYCWVRRKQPHTIVEIGTYRGRSAFVFASAQKRNNHGELYTIDNDKKKTVAEARARLETVGRPEKTTVLKQSSYRAFSEWVRARIDLLYIDGSHKYLDAVTDFALWSRHVNEDGLIVMHDTRFCLERNFPFDYIYPQKYYDYLHVTGMTSRPSRHEWKGTGFVTVNQAFRENSR